MTTLAIVGSGIVGRSLLYNLTAVNFSVDEVILVDSSSFARPCSLYSSAIVAPRGVTRGHSALGDLIVDGFERFAAHVRDLRPDGVYPTNQFTGGFTKLSQLKLRYPGGTMTTSVGGIGIARESYMAREEAFMVDPSVYLEWLLSEAKKKIRVTEVNDFVIDYEEGRDDVTLRTHGGKEFRASHVVFATGATSRFWARKFPVSLLTTSRPVQGAFLQFQGVNWDLPAFSLTFEGHNVVYRKEALQLLLGSTTHECLHEIPPLAELHLMYDFVKTNLDLNLPSIEQGRVIVGVREKAKKRAPYLFTEGRVSFLGGLYKNGYILSLKMTRTLADRLPGHF